MKFANSSVIGGSYFQGNGISISHAGAAPMYWSADARILQVSVRLHACVRGSRACPTQLVCSS